jgi:hypothetical protein
MRRKCDLAFLIGCLAAVPAWAAPQCSDTVQTGGTTFCEGYYALCIKAPCTPVTTPSGSNQAECRCEVVKGWSMGPAACTVAERSWPQAPPPLAQVMSTYSNRFNVTDQTLTCESTDTKWAWCYGASCTVDAKDPSKAVCICPVCSGAASTLGGGCHQAACKALWSAATPVNDAFANKYFFAHQKEKGYPVEPPATACPVHPTPGH